MRGRCRVKDWLPADLPPHLALQPPLRSTGVSSRVWVDGSRFYQDATTRHATCLDASRLTTVVRPPLNRVLLALRFTDDLDGSLRLLGASTDDPVLQALRPHVLAGLESGQVRIDRWAAKAMRLPFDERLDVRRQIIIPLAAAGIFVLLMFGLAFAR